MYQIDNSTVAATQPASTTAGTPGFFTDGNPATGTPATVVPAEWLNAVMLELTNVITAAGLTPSKSVFNQVAAAIKLLAKQPSILADTGSANTYTAVNSTPLVSGTWVDGVTQRVKIANTNTGASTYSPDGLTAIPIYGLGLQPLQGGELFAGGVAALVRATIAGVNGGSPICVAVDCQGGAQQIPAGTKSNQAVNLGQFLQSLGPSGYFKLPGGAILQWSYFSASSSGYSFVPFPIAFPNASSQVVGQYQNSTSGIGVLMLNGATQAGFYGAVANSNNVYIGPASVSYFAVGY